MSINIVADLALVRVERFAADLGRHMAAVGGPENPEKVADLTNMVRDLPLTDPIRAAIWRGYAQGRGGVTC